VDQQRGKNQRAAHSAQQPAQQVSACAKLENTRVDTSQDQKASVGPQEAPAASVLLATVLEDSRVIHNNTGTARELNRWSKLVVIHEDHTIAVK
jgi:hypothetical protein